MFWKRNRKIIACSILFGFMLFISNYSVQAEEKQTDITIRYVDEVELTEEEKQLIQQGKPSSYQENDVFYMVYQATSTEVLLPQTGEQSTHTMYIFVAITFSIAVVIMYVGRKKDKTIVYTILFISLGFSIFPYNTRAIESKRLSHHNNTITLSQNQPLPDLAIAIDAYQYIGFIRVSDTKKNDFTETRVYQETKTIPYHTIYHTDNQLDEGQTVVQQKGVNGTVITTYEETRIAGEVVELKQLEQITTPAVDEIIVQGTKKTTRRLYQVEEDIEFKTVQKEDATLAKGEIRIVEGVLGTLLIHYEEISVNDVVVEVKELHREVIKQAVDKQILIGTKDTQAPVVSDLPNVQVEWKDEISISIPTGQDDDQQLPSVRINGLPNGLSYQDYQIFGTTQEVGEFPIQVTYTDQQGNETVKEFVLRVISDAEKEHNQAQIIKQVISVGETANAANSVKHDSLTDLVSIVWIEEVNNQLVNEEAPARIRILFTDGSYQDHDVLVDVRKNKQKPIIEIATITTQDLQKKVLVTYQLTDVDKTYVSASAELFQGDRLVRSIAIQNIQDILEIENLELDTEYTLKTLLKYDLGTGHTTSLEVDVEHFQLTLKKIEIKHIDRTQLYSYQNNQLIHHVRLDSIPEDLSRYFVRIDSSQNKDIYLPIQSAALKEIDGRSFIEFIAHTEQLVQDVEGEYQQQYRFFIAKSNAKEESNQITSFKELVEKMRQNPYGHFTIIQDISATEVELNANELAYVDSFYGTLTAEHQNRVYAIYDLKAPLIRFAKDATIHHLVLKDASIQTNKHEKTSTLVTQSDHSTFNQVVVEASIRSTNQKQTTYVGGIVGSAYNRSTITNSFFYGDIQANVNQRQHIYLGGILGYADSGTVVQSSQSDVSIKVATNHNNHKVGGLVGYLRNGKIEQSYVTGVVLNASEGKAGQVGAIVGSTWPSGSVRQVVSAVKVSNGNQIHGDGGFGSANIQDSYVVEHEIEGKQDKWSTVLTKEEAQSKINSFGLVGSSLHYDVQQQNVYHVDYQQLEHAQANRIIAYRNMEKLLPFYNKEFIVRYGNLVEEQDKLNRILLQDVVPMYNEDVVVHIAKYKELINRIMLHYQDGSIDYLPVSFIQHFDNPKVLEYDVVGKGLMYTPEVFVDSYDDVIEHISPVIKQVVYHSPEIYQVLYIEEGLTEQQKQEKLAKLYLEEKFQTVQENIEEYFVPLLTQDAMINHESSAYTQYLMDRLVAEKASLLLSFSYIDRWFDIHYPTINIKNLILYKQDFYANQDDSSIKALLQLANLDFEAFHLKHNIESFAITRNYPSHLDELTEFLSYNKQLFARDMSMDSWFKFASKATIQEEASRVIPEHSVSVYTKFSRPASAYKDMILPLLSLTKEDKLFIISTIASISFGIYDRYLDRKLEIQNPERYQEEVLRVRSMIQQAAIWQRDHYDTWYRMLPEQIRPRYLRDLPVWDDFLAHNKWLPQYGDTAQGILDFFGPLDRWHVKWNDSGAFANGSGVWFVWDRVLTQYGSSVLTHEMVHNSDGGIYFHGYGRRDGMGAELYALGFLQVPSSDNQATLGLNLMYDFSADNLQTRRLHAKNTDRYQNIEDVNQYVQGMMDVLYVLNYAEATAMLKYDKSYHKKWFNQLVTVDVYGKNIKKSLTEEEWNQIDLRTIDDLIDHDILVKRGYGEGELGRNGYYTVNMFSPIYATAENPDGSPGDLSFRATAYEVWAEKGYEGFLGYISNRYKADANAIGLTLLTDRFVLDKIFGGEYTSFKEFKKEMYRKRIERLNDLISINLVHQNTEYQISNFEQLQQMIEEAIQYDIQQGNYTNARNSRLQQLKTNLYNAYLRATDDFKIRIFNN